MPLPLAPPLPPMLAKLADELPDGGHAYEPKLDGFRCVAFRDGDAVELQSRHGNPLGRYFPEVVASLRALDERELVLDGELVPVDGDFTALMQRLHPAASRVELLAARTPAALVAFDVLALGSRSLLDAPYEERRGVLDRLAGGLQVAPSAADPDAARAWLAELEGVVAKRVDQPYEPGRRGWTKVKRRRTADCVVAGVRWRSDRPLPSSLLLGLYDAAGRLEHVGVASGFGVRQAQALLEELKGHASELDGHPWEHGFLLAGGPAGRLRGAAGRWVPGTTMDWTPLRPDLVAEVTYDQADGPRFRHPARFVRFRPDRDPHSCTDEQLR